ncbi:flagellar hook-basal body complex protein FliE [Monaibacterium marinum]|uniref:Flagellar hook-basal body complex protein FliE n=1 Tax=Pontivivens marinum TaxID=1690039 RepID=A0A2C9CUY7_9RHOB|nr:flagellar hook-basal body complex protein FliE [Monaibacterium marinum]SOH95092.1 flagellar hook-basal body complex protein FliE [Monaibacterium marinum]
MDIQSTLAGQAYGLARQISAKPQVEPVEEFAQVAADMVSDLQSTEQAARGALAGTVDPHAMVQALAETELAVETAVTLRDKVVEAYQEILRMPV